MTMQLPANISTSSLPQTYLWVGGAEGDWHDPSNWQPNSIPDHPEATVIFRDVDSDVAVVRLNKPAVLSNIWFECSRTAYRIDDGPSPEENTGLFFSTGQQLANIVLSDSNAVNHMIPAMIMHSCKKQWGPGWFMKTIPSGGLDAIPREASRSKITYSGPIGSYKDAPRASLNLDGYIDVELSGDNTFVGPIDVRRGSLIVAGQHSIPDGSVMSVYTPGQVLLNDGIKIRLKELHVDGQQKPDGVYPASVLKPGLTGSHGQADVVIVDSSLNVIKNF